MNKYLTERVFEKSIVSKKFIKKGKIVTINDLDFKKEMELSWQHKENYGKKVKISNTTLF